ncbi:DMT family transporter [Thermoflavimicrobium dichotomicum]|uniref:Permease of the drug/metabolite transporter (DMT) superfamily n=1 Tax=Thermoflavimicrobium dichotomicum TaxID=46223 RepID=A0A1I3UQC9_9BACL|nr:DMT family transporter [Thermoflavimicrobium dichotomicum]SFJ84216.1 Permease of the drug/metabolite transporter (DMT) superfamily [Thermoflavimicrobium dichotomicum]
MNTSVRCPVPPVLVLFIGIVAVSFSAIFIKWSHAPAAVMGMHRLFFSIIIMLPFLRKKHVQQLRQVKKRDFFKLGLAGLFLGLHFLFWIGSLKYTSVASSTILLVLQPIFVMIGAYFIFKERTHVKGIISMLIAMLGTVLVGWGDIELSSTALYGDFLSIIGTLAVSFYVLAGQELNKRMSPLLYNVLVFAIASVVLFFYNAYMGYEMIHYPKNEWIVFLLLALVPTIFGHGLFNWLMQYVSATTISVSILGEPVGSTVLAYFLLGETMTLFHLIGGALSIMGVWLFLFEPKSAPQKAA